MSLWSFLRGIYVEITIRDAQESGQKISTGRISILSGVAKRDVERLSFNRRLAQEFLSQRMRRLLQPYCIGGTPIRLFWARMGFHLSFRLTGQGGRNFTDLVGGSPVPIDPTSAYEQLLPAKMIAKSGDTHVKVLSRSYVMPEPLSAAMLEHFGSAMTNLASTLNFNMTPAQKSKRLERSVFPDDGLPEELRAEFDQFVRERAQELISDVDDWLAAAARRPIKNPSQAYQYWCKRLSVRRTSRPADRPRETCDLRVLGPKPDRPRLGGPLPRIALTRSMFTC